MGVVIKLYSGEIKNSKHSQFSSEWSKAPESTPNFAVTSNLHGTSINDHLIPNYNRNSETIKLSVDCAD